MLILKDMLVKLIDIETLKQQLLLKTVPWVLQQLAQLQTTNKGETFKAKDALRAFKSNKMLNQIEMEEVNNPEISTRISQYEMAFKMQASVPELTDLSKEPAHTFELYGEDARRPGTYAANCLLARKLSEKQVTLAAYRLADVLKKIAQETP